jgi:superfamily II DNA or RNA helicase
MKKIYEFEHYAELRGNMWEDKHRIQEQRKVISTNLSDKCSLILCDRIAEMDLWEEYFEIYDEYNIIVIKWDTKITDDKRQLEEALISNKPIIIIGSISKCSTWFDFPIISSVFIFSSIKFQNTVIQSIGRSLRKSPWKTGSKIYVWNDHILQKQKIQKQSVILEEYKIDKKDIVQIDINKHRKKKGKIALEF